MQASVVPLNDCGPSDPTTMTHPIPSQSPPLALGAEPARILVVEDDAQMARMVQSLLASRLDCQITVANTGQEARRALKASLAPEAMPFDLVLLDMHLPDTFGREVLEWIRGHARLRYTRVIILTALTSKEELIAALSAGADDYLTKPFLQQELLARVETTLRSHEMEKQLEMQSRQLALLSQIGTRMVAKRNIDAVLDEAVDGVRLLLNTELGAIFFYEGRHQGLHCPRASSSSEEAPVFSVVPLGYGLISQVFSEQTPLRVDRPEEWPAFSPSFDAPRDIPVHNMLLAPLRAKQKCIGVLVAANRREGRFSESEFDLFKTLANAVSHAVENAMLFSHTVQQKRDLMRSRDRLQAVIDGIQHPIYTVDASWQVQAINQSQLDELPAGESPLGQICHRVFFGRELPCPACAVPIALEQGAMARWSDRSQVEDHQAREWEVTAYPIPAPRTERRQAVVVWEDVTEERRLEYSLLQAGKMAAIGQLAAGVAHEMNNPLSVITASAQMLKVVTDEASESYELVDLIDQASERAGNVVRELLDFARQKEYQFAETDINESIRQALTLVSYQLQTAGVQVDLSLTDDLPATTASAEHLKSVWINIMINARDALEGRDGERRLDITTRLAPEDGQLHVQFRDNGTGMSASEREHIFEPFYTTKEPGQGTGLGLSTSHRIIEQHTGEIEVNSEPGEGTTFVIRLPVSA